MNRFTQKSTDYNTGETTVNIQKTCNLDTVLAPYLEGSYAFCINRTGNRHDAEDLSQDIVLEICRSFNTLRNPAAFHGWMWSVARNTYKRWLSGKKQTAFTPMDIIEESSLITGFYPYTEGNVDDRLLEQELAADLIKQLARLSCEYREMIIKHYFEEKKWTLKVSEQHTAFKPGNPEGNP